MMIRDIMFEHEYFNELFAIKQEIVKILRENQTKVAHNLSKDYSTELKKEYDWLEEKIKYFETCHIISLSWTDVNNLEEYISKDRIESIIHEALE